MSEIAQCPFCELRFAERWELKLHLDDEHPGRIREKEDPELQVIIEDSDPNNPKSL